MSLSRIETRKLKKNLPNGWAHKIAKGRGCTAAYVRLVLNGKRENLNILTAIIDLARKQKQVLEKQRQTIDEL